MSLSETKPKRIEDFQVGESRTIEIDVTEQFVDGFAEFSGDYNPLHMSDDFAAEMGMTRRVAHGMSYGSLISTLIGMHLPGPGALWASQRISWAIPVRVGDKLRLTGTISHISVGQKALSIDVLAVNQNEEKVLTGTARVVMPSKGESTDRTAAGVSTAPAVKSGSEKPLVLITGGSGEVGRAIAYRMAAAGADIALHYRSQDSVAEKLCDELRQKNPEGEIKAFRADFANEGSGRALVEEISAQIRTPDVVVLNASPMPAAIELGRLDWTDHMAPHFEVDLRASLEIVQALAPNMRESRFGRVIGVLSNKTRSQPEPELMPYIVAKAAMESMLKCLAVELGPYGITVNGVVPGMMNTPMTEGISERLKELQIRKTPTRRMTEPSDVAELVAYLASRAAQQINGAMMSLDGGERI